MFLSKLQVLDFVLRMQEECSTDDSSKKAGETLTVHQDFWFIQIFYEVFSNQMDILLTGLISNPVSSSLMFFSVLQTISWPSPFLVSVISKLWTEQMGTCKHLAISFKPGGLVFSLPQHFHATAGLQLQMRNMRQVKQGECFSDMLACWILPHFWESCQYLTASHVSR